VEKYCQEKNLPFKILLILDNAPGHPIHLDISPNVKVVYLPPTTTSLLQPMDQGAISNFKAYYLRRTIVQAIDALDSNPEPTLREFWQKCNIYDAIKNIAAAWAEVPQACMKSDWKRLTPHLVPDFRGFADNDETFEQVAAETVKLAEKLQLEVDEDVVDVLVESHDEELSNEELIELEAVKVADNEQHDNEEPEVQAKRFTAKDMRVAALLLNNLYEGIERQDPDLSRFQRIVNDAFSYYRGI
jgi:hypothetical protein